MISMAVPAQVRAVGLKTLVEKAYLMFVVASCCESFSRSRLTVTRTKFFYQPDQLLMSLIDIGKPHTNIAGICWHLGISNGIVVGMMWTAGAESDGSKSEHAEKGNS
jgi:hypothetical protein